MSRVSRLNQPAAGLDSDRRYGVSDVYNWKASNTRRLQRSMAKVFAGLGKSDHLIVGDSTSSLYTGTVTYTSMWPIIMQNQLAAKGYPLGGCWVAAYNDAALALDPRISKSGTWTQGSGILSSTLNDTLTFTSTEAGTTVGVAYLGNSGSFKVSIDGGAATTVTPTWAPNTVGVWTTSGLADTTHTVVITQNQAGVNLFLMAVGVYKATGLRVHNLAQSGSRAAYWAGPPVNSRGQLAAQLSTAGAMVPDVVHVAIGLNDIRNNLTVAATATAVGNILAQWPNADRILYAEYSANDVTADWQDYVNRLYALAREYDCPLIDLYRRSGGYVAANANGMMGDNVHPNTAAQADWGQLVTGLITSGL